MPVTDVIEIPNNLVKTKYEANADTNAFTDSEKSKLSGIEPNATADQSGAEIVSAIDTQLGGNAWQSGGGGSSIAYDDLSSGNLFANITRQGGSATTIASPSAGEFNLDIKSGAHIHAVTLFGNNTTLNASQEMIIRLDNSDNSRDRRVSIQLYDAGNGALVNQHATGTNHSINIAGNVTVITIPGLNGFSATGFFVEIR